MRWKYSESDLCDAVLYSFQVELKHDTPLAGSFKILKGVKQFGQHF